MKRLKKLVSVLLAVVMVLAMSVAAFAAEGNPVNGETYTAYKIFDATISGEAAAYSIANGSAWLTDVNGYTGGGLTLTQTADKTGYVVTVTSDFSAAAFAAYLAGETAEKTADGTATAADGTASFTGLTDGYYLVTSSLGSICQLTTAGTLTIKEKNTVPTVDKKADKTSASIGEEIQYTLTFTDGKGTQSEAVIEDTLPGQLTYVENSISYDSQAVTSAAYADGKITVKIDTAKLEEDKDNSATVIYKAYINNTATANTAIQNTAKLTYSQQSSESTATVKTYDFAISKVDGEDQPLAGAEFTLYTDKAQTKAVTLIAVEGGYQVAGKTTGNTTTTIEAGSVNVSGLAAGTYYLVETKAPAGYNLLTKAETIAISENQTTAATTSVVNEAGSTLPTTGGMGTTVLYAVGILLVLGAGVTLVVRRRMGASK